MKLAFPSLKSEDKPILIASAFILVILSVGTACTLTTQGSAPLLSPGRYAGTLVGVILIVLLNSVLSIMQMPEAGRQVIYGSVIICMLLVDGRGSKVHS